MNQVAKRAHLKVKFSGSRSKIDRELSDDRMLPEKRGGGLRGQSSPAFLLDFVY